MAARKQGGSVRRKGEGPQTVPGGGHASATPEAPRNVSHWLPGPLPSQSGTPNIAVLRVLIPYWKAGWTSLSPLLRKVNTVNSAVPFILSDLNMLSIS